MLISHFSVIGACLVLLKFTQYFYQKFRMEKDIEEQKSIKKSRHESESQKNPAFTQF